MLIQYQISYQVIYSWLLLLIRPPCKTWNFQQIRSPSVPSFWELPQFLIKLEMVFTKFILLFLKDVLFEVVLLRIDNLLTVWFFREMFWDSTRLKYCWFLNFKRCWELRCLNCWLICCHYLHNFHPEEHQNQSHPRSVFHLS